MREEMHVVCDLGVSVSHPSCLISPLNLTKTLMMLMMIGVSDQVEVATREVHENSTNRRQWMLVGGPG